MTSLRDLSTPALLVDLDALESNLYGMSAFFQHGPAKLRPHFKNHKSIELARKQLQAGAIGLTCATVREVELLVEQDVASILLANEVLASHKLACLAGWSQRAEII